MNIKKRIIILMLIFIFLVNIVSAVNYIKVENVHIDSFGGLISSNDEIYVGSVVRYNISLKTNYSEATINQEFNVVIINPSREVIENQTFVFAIPDDSSFIISSNVSNVEWRLIYADVSGIYKLVLTSNSALQLYENKSTSFRHDYSLPFFFEVKSLQEKRLADANENLIKRNEEIANQSENINQKMLRTTKNTFIATIAMLFVALITLFSMPEGRKTISKIISTIVKILLIVTIVIMIIFTLIILFSK